MFIETTPNFSNRTPRYDWAAFNRKMLVDIAAWAISDEDVLQYMPNLTGARLKQARTQINRDAVRVTMLVLALDGLSSGDATRETFSIRKLAKVLDGPRQESMQRTLRNWLLPLLRDLSWIEGFVETEDWSSSPHEISISDIGLERMKAYFQKLISVEAEETTV